MRSAEELQAELVRTRRRLHRVTGVMTFVFVAGVAVVFAAVGGALVVVDKRAAQTLQPAPSSPPHQTTATAPQPPAATTVAQAPATPTVSAPATTPPPAISADAGASAGASAGPRASAAAAPANPPPQAPQAHPQTPAPSSPVATTAAINPTPPAPQQQPVAGSGRGATQAAQPAAPSTSPAPAAQPSPPIDTKHTARTHPSRERKTAKNTRDDDANADNPRHDARTTVSAAPSDTASRSEDARERRRGYVRVRPGDEEAADAPGPQRVIVLGPRPRYAARPDDERNDDQGEPPRQRGLFGGILSGIFGPPDQ